jgi:hypothetical protein
MLLADCTDFLCSEEWYVLNTYSFIRTNDSVTCRYAERG